MDADSPKLTDERLRTYLLDQASSERMCLALLATDGRFSDLKPRRPKGGPDGGRDIQAVHKKGDEVWGAVGFRRTVSDSAEDRTWAQAKFRSDLEAAKNENPDLWGFVFFTNVDLTPTQVDNLEEWARQRGVVFTEVFYRERLRIILDRPVGMAIRYQYLRIRLSEAEQAAFFARWGTQLEQILLEGFSTIDEKLRRLEFLQDCTKPLRVVQLILRLNRECTADRLGHYRAVAQIRDAKPPHLASGLWVGCRDHDTHLSHGRRLISTIYLAWSKKPDDDKIQRTIMGDGLFTSRLRAFADVRQKGPYAVLGDLAHRKLSIYVTEPLLELLSGIALVANDYVVGAAEAEGPVYMLRPPATWQGSLSPTEETIPWAAVLLRRGPSPGDDPQRSLVEPGWPCWTN